MTKAAADVLRAALDLSETERLDVAGQLVASIGDSPLDDPEYRRGLDQLAKRARSQDPGISWSALRARVERRLAEV